MRATPCDDLRLELGDVFRACGVLTVRGLDRLAPAIARRIAQHARPFVVLSTAPLRAGIFVEAEGAGAEPLQIANFAGADLPEALDAAAAAIISRQLTDLSIGARDTVAGLMRGGARLALVVDAVPPAATLLLFTGAAAPHVVSRLALQEQAH